MFNLRDDPMEMTNLLKKNPEQADRLRKKLGAWRREVSAKMPKR